jgi:ribosomal protein S18 acetylase RimI-like enzyme
MFSIKKAGNKDAQLIHDLASRVWGPTYGAILSPEQLNYMFDLMYAPESIVNQMTELGHQYFIVYDDETPSGYISIEKKEEDTYIFQKIYALPEKQGTGMGRFMFEEGVRYLKGIHAGPFKVMLYVNRENPAIGFYEHIGFRQIDTRDHHIGNGYYMNDYIMCMEVD